MLITRYFRPTSSSTRISLILLVLGLLQCVTSFLSIPSPSCASFPSLIANKKKELLSSGQLIGGGRRRRPLATSFRAQTTEKGAEVLTEAIEPRQRHVHLKLLSSMTKEALHQFSDLLMEGGALAVSYDQTSAPLQEGNGLVLQLTVPEEVDLEGLLHLAYSETEDVKEGNDVDSSNSSSRRSSSSTDGRRLWKINDVGVDCLDNWLLASREEGFAPQVAGKFQMVPVQTYYEDPPEPMHQIRILAGEGWGTGQHPTTRLCLDFLSKGGIICGGERIIDYGTGSGVLSIAAVQMGAMECVGIDIEYDALISAATNLKSVGIDIEYDALINAATYLKLNGVENEIDLVHPREVVPGEFQPGDIVLANILVGTLLQLSNTIIGVVKPGGWLCLCGLRPDQIPAIKTPLLYITTKHSKYSNNIIWDDGMEAWEEIPASEATYGTGAGWWVRLAGRRRGTNEASSWIEALSEAAVS